MTANETIQISPAEWEVMRVVWTAKQTTSKEIGEILNDKMDWKPATTKTLIGRLVKKGMLETTPEGRSFLYSPAVSEEETIQESGSRLLDTVCKAKAGTMLAHMIEEATLSQTDIERLQELLERKKVDAPAAVTCDCLRGQCECHQNQK